MPVSSPLHARFPDGRLHLQHGPIDCIAEAWGAAEEVDKAYAQIRARFEDVLDTLVGELEILKAPLTPAYPLVRGPVARRMVAATWPFRTLFITPMAAVAGAVADELLEAMVRGRELGKAYVNDGGDIAVHLAGPAQFDVGIATDPASTLLAGSLKLRSRDPVRGIATSGWRGRSQSLGIADAVTVLAATAAAADAAATMIANAVDIQHPAIQRLPARQVKEDSDLGDLLVTVDVGVLPPDAISAALDAGEGVAQRLCREGLITGASLALAGQWRTVGLTPPLRMTAQC